jgi:hypothetical protein
MKVTKSLEGKTVSTKFVAGEYPAVVRKVFNNGRVRLFMVNEGEIIVTDGNKITGLL